LRLLVNTAYAYLAEGFDAADRAARPVYLAKGVEPDKVQDMSERAAFDDWLNASIGREAEYEAAVLRELGMAG
jgi:hypothetical protein